MDREADFFKGLQQAVEIAKSKQHLKNIPIQPMKPVEETENPEKNSFHEDRGVIAGLPTAEDCNKWSKCEYIEDVMIEFARMHVKAALKAASEEAVMDQGEYYYEFEINKDSILNSYPEENIK